MVLQNVVTNVTKTRNALNVLRVHADDYVHLNGQHWDGRDTTRYHAAVALPQAHSVNNGLQ
jgi:hypothetical protein